MFIYVRGSEKKNNTRISFKNTVSVGLYNTHIQFRLSCWMYHIIWQEKRQSYVWENKLCASCAVERCEVTRCCLGNWRKEICCRVTSADVCVCEFEFVCLCVYVFDEGMKRYRQWGCRAWVILLRRQRAVISRLQQSITGTHTCRHTMDFQYIPLKVNDWQTPADILIAKSKSDVQCLSFRD